MSYFTEQNYFVIASDNYKSFSSRIYGYVIDGNTMYHNYIFPDSSIIPEFTKENVGFFTLIKREQNKIEISMDAMGYGLVYYYNDGEFWAASNSFYKLMTYLKTRVKLTFDSEYGYLFTGVPHYATIVHSRSLIKEIKLLALNEKIVIDTNLDRMSIVEFAFDPIVKINTAEGLAAIDKWAYKWIKFVRLLAKNGEQINVQLSGGFDSRFVMALILASGIDMDKINIESKKGAKEDFEIASSIAEHYNFKLNAMMKNYKHHNMDAQSILDANIFSRLGNHKEFIPYSHYICYENPVFMFGGYGCMRCWFQDSTDGFIRFCYRECIDTGVSKEAIKKVCEETFEYVEKRFNYSITRQSNLLNYAYNYGRGRYNYGTSVQVLQATNQFMCSPISDPMLICIDPIYNGNDDYDILCCYVMYRFAPDLLTFPFDKNRSFRSETVEKAKAISDSMPISFDINEDVSSEPMKIMTSYSYNGSESDKRKFPVEDFLKMSLEKISTRDIYTSYYGEDKFNIALNAFVEKKNGHHERDAFGVFAVTECVKACRSSWQSHDDQSLYRCDLANFSSESRSNITIIGRGADYDAFFLGQYNLIYMNKFPEAAVTDKYLKGKPLYILEYNDVGYAVEHSEFVVFSGSEDLDEIYIDG